MSYNVQPLRTNEEIQDFQFWLRRTSNPERDSFLFLFGINNGLRMSDIIGLKVGDIRGKSKPIIVEHKTGKRKPIFIDNLREEILLYTEGKEENDWLPDLDDFKRAIKDNTKMICLVNPNNPTSTMFSKEFLLELIEIAKAHQLYILCDEVYQGLGEDEVSISDLYDLGIATSSLSKITSYAGLRIGWIKANCEIIKMINDRRDYHIISTGYINDYLATIVVENYDKILKRSRKIIETNRQILIDWLEKEPLVDCVVPKVGTIAFLKYKLPIKSKELCIELQKDTGVFFVPGACFKQEYHLRFGFANNSKDIKIGLELFSKWLHKDD